MLVAWVEGLLATAAPTATLRRSAQGRFGWRKIADTIVLVRIIVWGIRTTNHPCPGVIKLLIRRPTLSYSISMRFYSMMMMLQ